MTNLLKQCITSKNNIGAIAQSSDKLAEAITSIVDIHQAKNIVELGPGTGVFTKKILQKKTTDCNFFSMEFNQEISRNLQKKFPEARIINDCASNIDQYLDTTCDLIISSLPWGIFDFEIQTKILKSLKNALAPNGTFLTYSYIFSPLFPSGKFFKNTVGQYFNKIETSPIIWRNLPPAFIYQCQL